MKVSIPSLSDSANTFDPASLEVSFNADYVSVWFSDENRVLTVRREDFAALIALISK